MGFINNLNFRDFYIERADRLDARVGHINALARYVDVISEIKEFLVVTILNDSFTVTKTENIIDGKNTYENIDGILFYYNLNDERWELISEGANQAYISSVNDIPPGGSWTSYSGPIYQIYITDYSHTLQEHIEYLNAGIIDLNAILGELPRPLNETIVDMSPSDIVNSGSTIISMPSMPDLDPLSNSYYYIDKIFYEYTHNGTPYNGTKSLTLIDLDTNIDIYTIPVSIFTGTFSSYHMTPMYTGNMVRGLTRRLAFKSLAGAVSGGDGTLRVKIYWKENILGI
jgi:hypothetical protein